MGSKPTNYERLVTILSQRDKNLIVAWCEEHNYRVTQVMREALRMFFKSKGIKLS